MSSTRRVFCIVAAVLLCMAALGCSICPLIPERATPTPSHTPTPPPPTATPTRDPGDWMLLDDARSGISLFYPDGWVYETVLLRIRQGNDGEIFARACGPILAPVEGDIQRIIIRIAHRDFQGGRGGDVRSAI